ncbi:MAG: hypothetical protein C0392_04975 [Syntrophus sp. (in: bacteria)]|nr:hypothetical protein [Syntrophus sp. (in: bacteria)]
MSPGKCIGVIFMKLEIVCSGIGGRGVLLASTIVIETAVKAGYRAVASDEYGMSQRGGSVVSLVKIGDFKSPLIGSENAGLLLAFEESEFYRTLQFLKKGGIAVVNTDKAVLPEAIDHLLKERNVVYHCIDADSIAKEKGMVQASNMAVLGYFASLAIAPYTPQGLEHIIMEKVPKKVVEKNLEIFREGLNHARSLHP